MTSAVQSSLIIDTADHKTSFDVRVFILDFAKIPIYPSRSDLYSISITDQIVPNQFIRGISQVINELYKIKIKYENTHVHITPHLLFSNSPNREKKILYIAVSLVGRFQNKLLAPLLRELRKFCSYFLYPKQLKKIISLVNYDSNGVPVISLDVSNFVNTVTLSLGKELNKLEVLMLSQQVSGIHNSHFKNQNLPKWDQGTAYLGRSLRNSNIYVDTVKTMTLIGDTDRLFSFALHTVILPSNQIILTKSPQSYTDVLKGVVGKERKVKIITADKLSFNLYLLMKQSFRFTSLLIRFWSILFESREDISAAQMLFKWINNPRNSVSTFANMEEQMRLPNEYSDFEDSQFRDVQIRQFLTKYNDLLNLSSFSTDSFDHILEGGTLIIDVTELSRKQTLAFGFMLHTLRMVGRLNYSLNITGWEYFSTEERNKSLGIKLKKLSKFWEIECFPTQFSMGNLEDEFFYFTELQMFLGVPAPKFVSKSLGIKINPSQHIVLNSYLNSPTILPYDIIDEKLLKHFELEFESNLAGTFYKIPDANLTDQDEDEQEIKQETRVLFTEEQNLEELFDQWFIFTQFELGKPLNLEELRERTRDVIYSQLRLENLLSQSVEKRQIIKLNSTYQLDQNLLNLIEVTKKELSIPSKRLESFVVNLKQEQRLEKLISFLVNYKTDIESISDIKLWLNDAFLIFKQYVEDEQLLEKLLTYYSIIESIPLNVGSVIKLKSKLSEILLEAQSIANEGFLEEGIDISEGLEDESPPLREPNEELQEETNEELQEETNEELQEELQEETNEETNVNLLGEQEIGLKDIKEIDNVREISGAKEEDQIIGNDKSLELEEVSLGDSIAVDEDMKDENSQAKDPNKTSKIASFSPVNSINTVSELLPKENETSKDFSPPRPSIQSSEELHIKSQIKASQSEKSVSVTEKLIENEFPAPPKPSSIRHERTSKSKTKVKQKVGISISSKQRIAIPGSESDPKLHAFQLRAEFIEKVGFLLNPKNQWSLRKYILEVMSECFIYPITGHKFDLPFSKLILILDECNSINSTIPQNLGGQMLDYLAKWEKLHPRDFAGFLLNLRKDLQFILIKVRYSREFKLWLVRMMDLDSV